jgi:hypothetical protein
MIADPKKYAPGTEIYQRIAATYGKSGADKVYAAALTMQDGAVPDALGQLKWGSPLETSTWAIFTTQLYNDPLGAPLGQLGQIASNSVNAAGNAAKRVTSAIAANWGAWLIVFAIAAGVFVYFGGHKWVKRRYFKA